MRVLAIDPGYGRCGVAVIEKTSGRDHLIHSACIETSKDAEFGERVAFILGEIEHMIRDFMPEALAMEKLFFNKNQKTAMRVAEVRGALLALAQASSLSIHEYSPGEIKSAVTGDGRAEKEQVARMVRMLVKIEKPIRLDDEYDAIAIGIAHLSRRPFERSFA